MPVVSQRLYDWAFETRIYGTISPTIFPEAAAQFLKGVDRKVRIWLLDASDVVFDLASAMGMLSEASQAASEAMSNLRAMRINDIALVLPELARPLVPMLDTKPIVIHSFNSRADAVDWLGKMRRRR